MTPSITIPGGSHPHALVGGKYVALRHGSSIQMHAGSIALPEGEPWGVQYLTSTRIEFDEAGRQVPGYRFCGQAHDTTNRLIEWSLRRGYRNIDGVNAGRCVYDRYGLLITAPIVYPDGSVSSQGYRYVNDQNQPVTGQETYGPRDGVSQYTELRDLLIGQGHQRGGVVVRTADGVLRELWPGPAYDIKVDWFDQEVAIAFWNPDTTTAYIYFTTRDALRALPPQASAAPPPNPVPVPVPVPQPKPEPVPTMSNVQNRDAALSAFWQQWNGRQPITDDAEKHRFTEALAGHLNALDGDHDGGRWGRKARAGTEAKSKDTLGYWLGLSRPSAPADGKVDAFDVIASSGAVSWDLRAEQNDPGYRNIDARWFPVAPTSAPIQAQVPATAPAAPNGPGAQLDAEILSLLTRLSTLETKVAELAARPVVIPAAPVSLAGQRIALKTNDGHFLCAEGGGGNDVHARRPEDGNPIEGYTPGGWETFTVEPQ